MKNNGMSILLIGLALVLLAGSVLLYHNVSERVPDYIPVSTPSPQYDRTEPAPASPKPASPSPSPAPTQSPFPRATDFSYTDSDGNSYQLSDLYGKPCILNFFATWCPPCRAELPAFDAAYQNYGDRINFLILDLIDSGNESVQNGLDFVAANGYGFPLFFDSLGEGYSAYGTGYVPVTVLISADGGLVDVHVGGLSEQDLQGMIDQLLNG